MANPKGRKPTREDLNKAAEAAMEAARAAESTAAMVADALGEDLPAGNGGGPRRMSGIPQETQTQGVAFEEFLAAIQPTLDRAGNKVRIEELTGWLKIEGVDSKERVYVAKGKRNVNRVTCTLSPDQVEGATAPTVPNGLIQSWLPAEPEAVSHAIELIAGIEPAKPSRRQRGR